MICYNCDAHNLPEDSEYCPFCGIKLFVECPKCGHRHSSQFPICNKCGTDREKYLAEPGKQQALDLWFKLTGSYQGTTILENKRNRVSGRIVIPDSVTKIGGGAFYYCTGLTSVAIPDSVIEIGDSAFDNCTGLTSVVIPDSVTEIGNSAFYKCTGLTSIVIPNSVTWIGSWAFAHCTGLTSIEIPDNVTKIEVCAFNDCTSLKEIRIHSRKLINLLPDELKDKVVLI